MEKLLPWHGIHERARIWKGRTAGLGIEYGRRLTGASLAYSAWECELEPGKIVPFGQAAALGAARQQIVAFVLELASTESTAQDVAESGPLAPLAAPFAEKP